MVSLRNCEEMDITKMLAELRAEREQLDEAILSLERLARGGGKRRGRPPKWMTDARTTEGSGDANHTEHLAPAAPAAKKRGRKKRVLSAESREKMAAAQKRRWAAERKEQPADH